MGIFILKKNEYMVQGFPVNRSYSKSEADAKFATSGLNFETPTGTIDGVNATFTVLNIPKAVVINGMWYYENDGYTRSGLTLTIASPIIPATGSTLRSAY